jgi:hypothetical protein
LTGEGADMIATFKQLPMRKDLSCFARNNTISRRNLIGELTLLRGHPLVETINTMAPLIEMRTRENLDSNSLGTIVELTLLRNYPKPTTINIMAALGEVQASEDLNSNSPGTTIGKLTL